MQIYLMGGNVASLPLTLILPSTPYEPTYSGNLLKQLPEKGTRSGNAVGSTGPRKRSGQSAPKGLKLLLKLSPSRFAFIGQQRPLARWRSFTLHYASWPPQRH